LAISPLSKQPCFEESNQLIATGSTQAYPTTLSK
jgi:hypothetical protein